MTQGLYIHGRRPKSKKEVREFVDEAQNGSQEYTSRNLGYLSIEATSIFGDEYDGPLSELPTGRTITFVGPCPYTDRKFYGNIKYNQKKGQWVVT